MTTPNYISISVTSKFGKYIKNEIISYADGISEWDSFDPTGECMMVDIRSRYLLMANIL